MPESMHNPKKMPSSRMKKLMRGLSRPGKMPPEMMMGRKKRGKK